MINEKLFQFRMVVSDVCAGPDDVDENMCMEVFSGCIDPTSELATETAGFTNERIAIAIHIKCHVNAKHVYGAGLGLWAIWSISIKCACAAQVMHYSEGGIRKGEGGGISV